MDIQKRYNNCSVLEKRCQDCHSNEFCSNWVKFVQQENHFKAKPYAHFDKRVSLKLPSVRKYIMDAKNIEKHGFYPLIHFSKKNSRYGKKGPKKPRELYYCAHLDRCVYQRYAFLINQRYNQWAKDNHMNQVAIAYRDNLKRNNIDFAKRAFNEIKEKSPCMIFVGDFADFFDKINHLYLKQMLCKVLNTDRLTPDYYAVFKNITRFSSWDWKQLVEDSGLDIQQKGLRSKINEKETILTKAQFNRHKDHIKKNKKSIGIPQGSPISAVLSNVYMMDFDMDMRAYATRNDGIYMRYSDDFILILPLSRKDKGSIAKYEDSIFSYIQSKDGLVDLQKSKTATYIFGDGKLTSTKTDESAHLDYLGFIFDGQNIRMRPKAITKYYYRMNRKARNIGKMNWRTKNGRRISAKELYNTYSYGGERQTFIDYAKSARKKLKLKDPEVNSVIKLHKRKIAHAIKRGEKSSNRAWCS